MADNKPTKRLSFWDFWGEKRKLGMRINIIRLVSQYFLVLMILRIFYAFSLHTIDIPWWHYGIILGLSFLLALATWFVMEKLYQRSLKRKNGGQK